MMNEIWRVCTINGETINYEASSLGRIRNATTKKIKPCYISRNGYRTVCIYWPQNKNRSKIVFVAKLVAEAFYGPRPEGTQIEHVDQNKLNNAITNLVYINQSRNINNSFRAASRRRTGVNLCLSQQSHDVIKRLWESKKYTQVELGKITGLTNSTICKIVHGKIHARPHGKRMVTLDFSTVGGER